MAIFKRGKFYWYRFDFQGKTYERSTRLKNAVVAAKVEAKVRTDLALGQYGLQALKPGPRFKDYVETFKAFLTDHVETQTTIAMYGGSLKRLLTFKPLANCRLNFIDEAVIEGYIGHQRNRLAVATLNADLRVLRRALIVARKKLKLMTAAPDISSLPGEHRRTFVLSYAQEAAYLAACPDVLRDAAILMVDTGLRVGECVAVKWEDLSLDGMRLNATDPSRFDPRVLWLSTRCREMLAYRRLFFPEAPAVTIWGQTAKATVSSVLPSGVATSTPYVFPGRCPDTHTTKGTLQGMHVTARQNARLEDGSDLPSEFVIHSLRHTFGTRFGELEPNAFIVRDAMGHADLQTTEIYVHVQKGPMERAFERLDAMNRLMRGDEKGRDEFRGIEKPTAVKR